MKFSRTVAVVAGLAIVGAALVAAAPASAAPSVFPNTQTTPSTTDLDISSLGIDYTAEALTVTATTQNFSAANGYSFVVNALPDQKPTSQESDYLTFTAIVTPTTSMIYRSITAGGVTGPNTPDTSATVSAARPNEVTLSVPWTTTTPPLYVWASLGDGVTSVVAGIPSAGGTLGFGPVAPSPIPTITTATVSSASQVLGATSAVVTAHVTPTRGAGTIAITDGPKLVASAPYAGTDVAIALPSNLAYGAHSLVAVYTPASSAYLGSSSAALPFTVLSPGVKTSTALKLSKTTQHFRGTAATVKVHVSHKPAGKVAIYDGKHKLTTLKLTKGSARFTVSKKLAKGKHHLRAVFTPKDILKAQPSTSKTKILKVVK